MDVDNVVDQKGLSVIMPVAHNSYVLVPEGQGSGPAASECCGADAYLPQGVCRVAPEGLGADRLMGDAPVRSAEGKVQVAAFDFDGTCIRGNSPVLLVRYLTKKRMLAPSVVLRILLWAGCYKARLPQNESWVRGLVFRAFAGRPVAEVNHFLAEFYNAYIDERFRPAAQEAMERHEAAGHAVVIVSASFEPLIAAAMVSRPIQYAVATRMKVAPNGTYTNQVEGLPIEGPQKVEVLRTFCDGLFGKGQWELAYAYGDHHSDRAMLGAARHACAVTPDRPLTRTANAEGYEILDWGQDDQGGEGSEERGKSENDSTQAD